ncbi:MAG TPA: GAF domain-containing protein [Candidatus Dormibacteraeota bacterium]|nr:GAF domain-containing protein [Candidatus Dormibacteraeota bacterium]
MSAPSPLTVPLESIASCFEGIIPSTICSCSMGGTPNLTYLSIVHVLDNLHVGLSYQFFNKTRTNILENPRAQVVVVSPETSRQYRLDLRYVRTETEGPSFERMKIRLDAVASQSGMSRVFKLRGVDIFEVLDCGPISSEMHSEVARKTDYLQELDSFTERLAACGDLDSLLSTALETLASFFECPYSFVMFPDEERKHLYTGASRGFEPSGVGSEVVIGKGLLGVVAERHAAVRTTDWTREMILARAVRAAIENLGEKTLLEREIPLPGLPNVRSQLILPLVVGENLQGVLCLQDQFPGRFLATEERVLQIAARHLAVAISNIRAASPPSHKVALRNKRALSKRCSVVKHYKSDDSIFIDDAYLIKGIPGRLLWKLLQAFVGTGRMAFTNKEIRLDADLRLPDIKDNLETRLILLRRRLDERCEFVRLVHAGRGQLQLEVGRRLTLEEIA